jgi:hypothetical protein
MGVTIEIIIVVRCDKVGMIYSCLGIQALDVYFTKTKKEISTKMDLIIVQELLGESVTSTKMDLFIVQDLLGESVTILNFNDINIT